MSFPHLCYCYNQDNIELRVHLKLFDENIYIDAQV